jgi:hypothetical protein
MRSLLIANGVNYQDIVTGHIATAGTTPFTPR